MRIVQPYAALIFPTSFNDAMSRIEWCGRISHRSEDAQTVDSWKRLIESVVIKHGDWSIVEHVSASVDMLVDRGITHELVRHRLFSFTQESTRFVNYNKTKDDKPVNPPSFIYPQPLVNCELCLSGWELSYEIPDLPVGAFHSVGEFGNIKWVQCPYNLRWLIAIRDAEGAYKDLLSSGWRPQEARSVFPNALASRIVVTGNLRSWRHLFTMRTTAETHPSFRQVSIPLLAQFKENFPLLYDDIEPMSKQSESMKRAR